MSSTRPRGRRRGSRTGSAIAFAAGSTRCASSSPLRGGDFRKDVLVAPDPVPVLRVLLERRGALLARSSSSAPAAPASRPRLPPRGGSAGVRRGPRPALTPSPRRAGAPSRTVPVPADAAPSGTLLRVGVKSDLPEFVYGPPGSAGSSSPRSGPRSCGGPCASGPKGPRPADSRCRRGRSRWRSPARERQERLAARFGVAGTVAFSADRGVYRVLLGSFPDRPSAEALAERLRGAGEEATVVEGRPRRPRRRPRS